ncbi:MAG: histone deacetylase family protein [Gammaproteobacteria bacterium]|nr:histone deacetylase family protein [Gammaproteobacteria bacterium]MDH5309604.1 histone deacetylase family protein [Gammaproteobacteria bacterium]
MKVVFTKRQLKHDPQTFFVSGSIVDHPEKPERAARLLAAALKSGLVAEEPRDAARPLLERLHTPRYLHYLENIFPRWQRIAGGSAEVIPGIHPDRRDCGYPLSAAGQAGFHHADLSSPINGDTWESALWSAHGAAHAAGLVLAGERSAYALSRPPGHHAARDYCAGFCYLANCGVAAEALLAGHRRVAVLDVDVHHGNGTQDVFYARGDVLTISMHADPARFYPFFWGHADETGSGDGEGCNLNLPLPRGTGDDDYLRVLDGAIDRIAEFGAGALVVALGLDAYEGDPLRGFAITRQGFARIGRRIGELGLPTVLIQEGGYLSDELGLNLSAALEGFMETHGG